MKDISAVQDPVPIRLGAARLAQLDGLRGWASLSVFLFHVFWEIFGVIYPPLRNPISGALFNGQLSVAIFFILSGESLSAPYWASGDRKFIWRQILKRYPRLTIPVAAVCLCVYLLLSLGLVYSHQAAILVHRPDWLGKFLPFDANFGHMAYYSLLDVYAATNKTDIYNPFLWTMHTEIVGSFLVFALMLADRYYRLPSVVFLVLAVPFFFQKSFVSCFLFGLIFARFHADGTFLRWQAIRWVKAASVLAMAIVFAYASIRQSAGNSSVRHFTIASALFVFAVHLNEPTTRFLGNGLSRFLGRISFPLYLIQFPVMVSFTSGAIVYAAGQGALTPPWIMAIAGATVLVTLGAAWVFTGVETATHWVCNRLARVL